MIVGFSVFHKLKNDFDFNKYDEIEIIITHLHNDHAGALSQFILYVWFIYNKKITIYSVCEKLQEYLDITGTTKEAYEIKSGAPNLEFIKTEHVKEMDSYGFKLQVENKTIVYTGDTCTLIPFMPYIDNCDEFYVDVSKYGGVHLKFEDVIDDLRKIKSKNVDVFLMHIDNKKYIRSLNNGEFFME